MIEYDSAAIYIDGATTLGEKITRIDAIINALLTTAAEAAGSDNISEYWLDDGQTRIKTVYRGSSAVFRSIEAFERLKQIYVNRLNGRVFRLVDSKNFTRR
jgi:hypothetical protein